MSTANPTSSHVRQVRSCPWDFCFLVLHPNIAFLWESARKSKVRTSAKHIALFVKCIIPRENMSPFLTCFPRLLSAKPFGWGHTRRAHVGRRPLIMPLVALVQKNHSAPATSYFRLVLGTRFGRRRCSSNSVFEKVSACIRTPAYTKCGKTAIFG